MEDILFAAPLSKDELRKHVLAALLVLGRQLDFVFFRRDLSHQQVHRVLFGKPDLANLDLPEMDAESLGITYDLVSGSALAETMEELYDFAFHGRYTIEEDLNSESSASWVSRILDDLRGSSFAAELHEYFPCQEALTALFSVCETVQARMVLEDLVEGDRFMDWHPRSLEQGLTIRQVALLSGMTEASLRTMANPNRKNPLPVKSDGRNTYVDAAAAKKWLIAKGRYVPLVNADGRGANLDLVKEPISSVAALVDRLDQRFHFLAGADGGNAVVDAINQLDPSLAKKRLFDNSLYLAFEENDKRLQQREFLIQLAKILQLPVEELVTKVAHLQASAAAHELRQRLDDLARRRTN